MCGGTTGAGTAGGRIAGLSPRVRGNPGKVRDAKITLRSIPACAGEPPAITGERLPPSVYPRVCGGTCYRRGTLPGPEVYPRVCGGTLTSPIPSSMALGLSPRVRGNRPDDKALHTVIRSIPACAGEPCRSVASPAPAAVYPRVCGGTHNALVKHISERGLSPRVRGNRGVPPRRAGRAGSIPACAGEPQ